MPEKEPSPWLTVQSKKEKFLSKKQEKHTEKSTPAKDSNEAKASPKSNTDPTTTTTTPTSTAAKKDNREELDFMFDEEISGSNRPDSESESDSDYECDEMDDQDISKLVIITQTPPVNRKPSVHDADRAGAHVSRSKITSELAKAINDGLYFYEQDLNKSAKPSLLDNQHRCVIASFLPSFSLLNQLPNIKNHH